MLHVKWGREVLHFPTPPLNTPLGKLRADLAEYTQLPVGSFKLVYKGAVMKEDTAPLSTYNLTENATIFLIGGHTLAPEDGNVRPGQTAPVPKAKPVAPQTEEGTILAIRAELERVRATLVPDVDAFVHALVPPSSEGEKGYGAAGYPVPPTPLDHTRLSELLLQSLLRLDALHMPGVDWPEARVQRKTAVREVQGVLDRLDGAWVGRVSSR
ncbi:hypothetical protein JVU11DRAFT_2316 [Chiua virens]|nr:hypothetical protein JVU11DRAFT_2316 [Chiua virens]